MNELISKKEFQLNVISDLISVKRGLIISKNSTNTLVALGFLKVKIEDGEMMRAITPIGNACISTMMASVWCLCGIQSQKEEK